MNATVKGRSPYLGVAFKFMIISVSTGIVVGLVEVVVTLFMEVVVDGVIVDVIVEFEVVVEVNAWELVVKNQE